MKNKEIIKNDFQNGQRFYALHMNEGVAEYRPPNEDMYRILIQEKICKQMDASFTGCPVYVGHVDDETKDGVVGYVVKSFFNQADGRHWAELIITEDAGLNAIRKKYRVSNAYLPEDYAGGGKWHGVDYEREVMKGVYKHLALVDDPRYEETMVLTPDEFKLYNQNKELELKKLNNSKDSGEIKNKETPKMKFNIFKRFRSGHVHYVSFEVGNFATIKSLERLIFNAEVDEAENIIGIKCSCHNFWYSTD